MRFKRCPDCGSRMSQAESKMFCATCRAHYRGLRPTSDRGEATKKLLDSTQWREFRKRILVRDMFRCQRHLRSGYLAKVAEDNPVDHIIPRHIRPDLTFKDWNVETLCPSCHNRKTYYEQRGRIISWQWNPDRFVVTGGTVRQRARFKDLARLKETAYEEFPGVNLSELDAQNRPILVYTQRPVEAFQVAQRLQARPIELRLDESEEAA